MDAGDVSTMALHRPTSSVLCDLCPSGIASWHAWCNLSTMNFIVHPGLTEAREGHCSANAPHFMACLDRFDMRSASSMVVTGRLGIIAAQCPHPRLTAARTHPAPFQHCARALRGMSSAAGSSRGSVRAAAQGNVLTSLKKAFGMGTTVRMHAGWTHDVNTRQ